MKKLLFILLLASCSSLEKHYEQLPREQGKSCFSKKTESTILEIQSFKDEEEASIRLHKIFKHGYTGLGHAFFPQMPSVKELANLNKKIQADYIFIPIFANYQLYNLDTESVAFSTKKASTETYFLIDKNRLGGECE